MPVPFGNKASLFPKDNLKELHLALKFLTKHASKAKPSHKTDIEARVSLPAPLVVASGDMIPFILTIHSESPALVALYTNVILQLVKVVKIKAYEKTSVTEMVISSGEVYNVDHISNSMQVLHGQLGSSLPEAESSWLATGLVETR
ncbi:hypothetical protein FRC10_000921, partial [Ceratobasidium sp. 414]